MRYLRRLICGLCLIFFFIFTFFSPSQVFAAVHTVSPGESIYLLGQWYGSSVEAIKRANKLTSDIIYPGQQLSIPQNRPVIAGYHTVRPGDTLYVISSSYGVSVGDLQSVNQLTSTLIYPGQRLAIPLPAGINELSAGGVSRGSLPYTRADFDLLARLITAEADSESFFTKVAVGAVVLNRVFSPLFPNTIREVIYHVDQTGAYQFEPVLNGWINVAPSRDAQRAAQLVLNGADPTQGALFFFESWVTNRFLKARPVKMIADSFTFTY